MKDLLTFLSVSESGKVRFIVREKDKSGELKLIYDSSFTTPSIFEPYDLRTFVDDIFEQTGFRIEEVIVIVSPKYYDITQNRAFIVRESFSREIDKTEIKQLGNDFFAIRAERGMKLTNVAPLHFSVDDEVNILNPLGMYGRRLEGTFKLMFVYRNLIHNILASFAPENIVVKKYIPENLSEAEPFLTLEEMESLYLISYFN